MKVVAVFTLILAVQASASFFDGFQSAFVSVENSFGKLLNDVVSDVKVTIDCTVVAVENALSLGGLFGDHSKYRRRCRGETAAVNQPVPNTILVAPTAVYETVTVPPVSNEKQSVKREIQSSVADVGNTIKKIIDKSRPLQGLKTVKTTLKKDVTMLDKKGSSLTKQLDDITSNVKKEVEQIGGGSGSTVHEMLDKINILHKVTDQKNDAESSQISHAFDEVMDAIHSNSTKAQLANDNAAKEIMKDLEQTSNDTFTDIKTTYSQFRNEENKHLDDIKDIVESKTKDILKTKPIDSVPHSYDLKEIVESKTKELLKTKPKNSVNKVSNSYDLKDIVESKTKDLLKTKSKETANSKSHSYDLKDIVESKTKDLLKTKPKELVNEGPKSFKSLAQQIMDEQLNKVETTIKTVESVTETPKPSTAKPPEDKNEPTEDPEMLLFNSYFGSNGQNTNTNNEAMSIIEKSMYSAMLMSKVSSNNGAVGVFDNPDLLNNR